MSKRERDTETKNSLLTWKWLRQRENEMATLLAELVGYPQKNPPGRNYCACADFSRKPMRHGVSIVNV